MERRHLITNLVAGTAAATAAFHMAYDPPQVHWGPERESHTSEFDTTSQSIGLRVSPDGSETDLFAPSEASPISFDAKENMEQNPTTGAFDSNDIRSLEDTLRFLSRSDYSQYRVVIRPHISAEDNSGAEDAGNSSRSQSNIDLARGKGQEMADFIQTTSSAFGLELPNVEVSEPVEQIITDTDRMWGDEIIINDALDSLVTQYGYTDVNDMVKRWRQAPSDAPQEVHSTLREIYGDQTYLDVQILTSEEEVCRITVTHHKDINEKTNDNEYPFPVIVPFYLPAVGTIALLKKQGEKIANATTARTPRTPKPPKDRNPRPLGPPSGPGFGRSRGFGRKKTGFYRPARPTYSTRNLDYRTRGSSYESGRLRRAGAWVAGVALVLGLGYVGAEKWNDTSLTSDGTCVDIKKQPDTWGVSIHPHLGDIECSGTTQTPDYTSPRQPYNPCDSLPKETTDGGTIVRRFNNGELESTQIITP